VRGYLESAWERAMKVQEVVLRAMAKRIGWWQAAEIRVAIRRTICGPATDSDIRLIHDHSGALKVLTIRTS